MRSILLAIRTLFPTTRLSAFVAGLLVGVVAATVHAAKEPPENIAPNAGFESLAEDRPQDWNLFSSQGDGIASAETARQGSRSLRMRAQGVAGAFAGVHTQQPVEAGRIYTFGVYMMNDRADPLTKTAHVFVRIEWLDHNENEIGRNESPVRDRNLSSLRWTWTEIKQVVAPEGATVARFVIMLRDGEQPSTGAIYIDDVALQLE